MKKILGFILMFLFIFTLSSCGKSNDRYIIDYRKKITNFDEKTVFNHLKETDTIKVMLDDNSYLIYRFNGYFVYENYKYKEYTCDLNYYNFLIFLDFVYNEETKMSYFVFLDNSIFDSGLKL